MKTRININDFSFHLVGYGHYRVTYTSQELESNGVQRLTICH